MPIYEFHCKTCDNQFETLRGMRDQSPAVCPACHGTETMRRLSLIAAPSKASGGGDACETSAAWGGPCCRTFAPGGG